MAVAILRVFTCSFVSTRENHVFSIGFRLKTLKTPGGLMAAPGYIYIYIYIYPPLLSRLVGHFGLKVLKHWVLEKGSFWPKISVKASTKGFAFRFGPQIWRITAVPQGGGRGGGGSYFAC